MVCATKSVIYCLMLLLAFCMPCFGKSMQAVFTKAQVESGWLCGKLVTIEAAFCLVGCSYQKNIKYSFGAFLNQSVTSHFAHVLVYVFNALVMSCKLYTCIFKMSWLSTHVSFVGSFSASICTDFIGYDESKVKVFHFVQPCIRIGHYWTNGSSNSWWQL